MPRRRRSGVNFWQILIGIGVVVSVALAAVTSFLYFQQKSIIDAQRQASITSCQAGNSYRENIKDTLYFFTDVLASQQPTADVQREVAAARDYLSSVAGTDPVVRADAAQFYQLLQRLSNVTKDPGLPALVADVKAHIAHINAPRNCTGAYSAAAG
jgi:hypothetical protein